MADATQATGKPWSTPQLIVLARGRPEEHVLAACKGNNTGPNQVDANCLQPNLCSVCSDPTGS
jgi:hypothetical protein